MRIFLAIAVVLTFLTIENSVAQDPCILFERVYAKKKKKPFFLKFPNLATCLKAVPNQHGEVVGTIEWCRKSYTQTGVDDCGRTIQWRATDITYRHVLCNGAYGECFTKTQLDSPVQYVVPAVTPAYSAKGQVTSAKGQVTTTSYYK